MAGQCRERPGVEEAEGGRRERSEQVVTTRPLHADPVTVWGISLFVLKKRKISKCKFKAPIPYSTIQM